MAVICKIYTYQTVIQSICNPHPECFARKEDVLLAQHVQLRVAIKHSSRYKLVEYANNERRKDREHDIVH